MEFAGFANLLTAYTGYTKNFFIKIMQYSTFLEIQRRKRRIFFNLPSEKQSMQQSSVANSLQSYIFLVNSHLKFFQKFIKIHEIFFRL